MDLSVGIAIAAAIFSGSGVGFGLLTLRQTASKDALEIMHKEMETFRPALDECRAECARIQNENNNLRSENLTLLRRVALLRDDHD
jgi:hypothetical protein